MLATDQPGFDYDLIAAHSRLVVDTRNALADRLAGSRELRQGLTVARVGAGRCDSVDRPRARPHGVKLFKHKRLTDYADCAG